MKPKTKKLGSAKNEGAAAAITGLPLHAVKWAKSQGCKAFRSNGTIDCDGLKVFLFENPPPDDDSEETLNIHLERAKDVRESRKLKEQKRLRIARELVGRSELRTAWARNVIACKSKLYASENSIAVEAGLVLGLAQDQIVKLKTIVTKSNRLAIRELHQGELGKCTCPNCEKEI